MSEPSFQDQGSVHHCYGCGAGNNKGLRLKSRWDGDEAVATWSPAPHHCGARKEFVNAGIIATLIDCHSLNLAIAGAYRAEARGIGSAPALGFVTGNLSVSYLKPTPIDALLQLRARITRTEGRKVWVSCTLSVRGEICASGEVLGIRVQRE
jgi:acyl-coenzyme A thioesterase PaaI-like protein